MDDETYAFDGAHRADVEREYTAEQAYSDALEAVAQGATKTETLEALGDRYGTRITVAQIEDEAVLALRDALKQGVEREDIDPSWF